ncbi:MAG: DUF1080 domain-containing protein [Bacteroidetes bacterium]|nr:DUF1080 domain-containing protein [Bacteroidota bacterium]
MKLSSIFYSVALVLLFTVSPVKAQWKKLKDKDLREWVLLNGEASFEIRKGTVTGTTKLKSPNSFLCTPENYGDFILECDVWIDPRLNSGIQIRSESYSGYLNGRVHGYQIEIDPSERGWSGGIYDEARRGWMYALDRNPTGKKAFRAGEWNHYRIEAVGNSIRTWINGVPCADMLDALTPSGFIALQVHSIGEDQSKEGSQVKWKNIKMITTEVEKHSTPHSDIIPQVSFLENTLSEREVKEGWKLLFDGKTSSGWMNARTKRFPESGWQITKGMLTVNPESAQKGGGGDIVTVDKFRNFELIVDFRYTRGANSGIKYFVDTEVNNGAMASIGCEYQILDDRNHPDAKAGVGGNRTLSSLYDLLPPRNKRDNGENIWNRATIIVRGNKVQHWLNDMMTLEYQRGTNSWKETVAASKFKNTTGFGETEEGRILLQDHGDNVSFKNIKIRELE